MNEKEIKNYIDGNSLEFKHFKLYADSTLKNMKKDELISYIHMLYQNWQCSDKSKQRLHNIIDDLTENNPLKFEELEVVKPYWNNKEKEWCYFATLHNDLKTGVKITISSPPLMSAFKFEENMFYRKEVKK